MTRDQLGRDMETRMSHIVKVLMNSHALPVVCVGVSQEPNPGKLVIATGEDVKLAQMKAFLTQLAEMVNRHKDG